MKPYSKLGDADLMSMVASGNHDAFSELVKRHTDRFFALAFRTVQNNSDAEDIVQTAFIKLWQNPTSWKPNKSQFTTWFYRVTLNSCHDFQRKNKRQFIFLSEYVNEVINQTSCSEQKQYELLELQKWQTYCLEYSLSLLPSSQRDALNLVVYSELPQKQAAEIMGISLKALESLLVRAKQALTSSIAKMSKTNIHSVR